MAEESAMNGVGTASPHPTGGRLPASDVREQPNSQAIEDNRSTLLPSASGQCSLVVRLLYKRLSVYPGSLVGFAVQFVGPCYDRGVSGWQKSPQ